MKMLICLIATTLLAEASQKQCYQVEGMVCGSCVKKIEAHFKTKSEIKRVSVSLVNERVDLVMSKKVEDKFIKEDFKKLNFKAEPISCD